MPRGVPGVVEKIVELIGGLRALDAHPVDVGDAGRPGIEALHQIQQGIQPFALLPYLALRGVQAPCAALGVKDDAQHARPGQAGLAGLDKTARRLKGQAFRFGVAPRTPPRERQPKAQASRIQQVAELPTLEPLPTSPQPR